MGVLKYYWWFSRVRPAYWVCSLNLWSENFRITAHMQAFDCWDRKEMRKHLLFLCSHLHLFYLYLNFQASLHPPQPYIHLSCPLSSLLSLSHLPFFFWFFFFFWLNLKTMKLICLVWFPVLFQCCCWKVSLLSQLLSSPFGIQMYLPHSQHTTARQRKTESLINFYFYPFSCRTEKGEAQDLSLLQSK